MISIPLPATIPKRKAAKRATAICGSNIVIVLIKHWSCDLGLIQWAQRVAKILAGFQLGDLERRDLLHAGRSGYRCGRIALNLGLQAASNRPRNFGAARAGTLIEGGARRLVCPVQECWNFSGKSFSLSAIRPSSGSERAFIFRIALLR
jgi:hypothetical protein